MLSSPGMAERQGTVWTAYRWHWRWRDLVIPSLTPCIYWKREPELHSAPQVNAQEVENQHPGTSGEINGTCFGGSPGQHTVILKQVNLCSIFFTSSLQFSVKSRRCNPLRSSSCCHSTHCRCQYSCSADFHPLDSLSSPEILGLFGSSVP